LLLRSSVLITILTLLVVSTQTVFSQSDSVSIRAGIMDSLKTDTVVVNDSVFSAPKKKKAQIVDDPVFYSASDSMTIFITQQKVLLWGESKIEYQDIELTSEHIISDLERQEVMAKGGTDTSGVYFGTPVFKKGSENFDADSLHYNIKTGKGLIYNVKSEQGEGYLHSTLTKRDSNGHVHMKGGKYTTCDADHPHFYMELTKAIAIPNDKIVSGYAYMVVEDVPIPFLGIPFGFFPSNNSRGSGIIIPTYSEEKLRGVSLRNGGWYQPLGQYVDMKLLGDIYAKGSWAVNWGSNYKVRYKFGGTTTINYNVNKDNSDNTFAENEGFKWVWSHRQDPKSNPTQSFSASVDFSSAGYDKNNSNSYSEVYRSQKSSSISFTKSFPSTPFNLSLSANIRQNSADSSIAMDLPNGSFNASTIYPFRSKTGSGKYKWYENIGLSYTSSFRNAINIHDTMLFEQSTWENLNYGFKHSIPLSINLKTDKIKMLTITPSLNYTGVMNSWYQTKRTEFDGTEQVVITDTVRQIGYAHAINPSITVGLTPKVTGMYLNSRTDPKIIAVRHVMQPRASFNYVPDMRKINPNYYDTVFYNRDGELNYETYSYFSNNNIYTTPSFNGESGSLSLGLSNNLEMKMKAKSDTVKDAEARKVVLLRSFNFSTSYNPFATSYKWSDVSFTSGTAFFKNALTLDLTSRFTPYDYTTDTSSSGSISYSKVDEFNYENGKAFLRFTNLSLSSSLTLRSKQGGESKKGAQNPDDQNDSYQDPFNPGFENMQGLTSGSYVDFNIPWSLSFRYSYSLTRPYLKENQTTSNNLNISGDFSLTPKWKIGFNSGYDFEKHEVTPTNFNIYRDLHCWEMRFTMTPFGTRQSYSFTINAKASLLKDLKYDRDKSWYDNL
jgi:hypothetical protein